MTDSSTDNPQAVEGELVDNAADLSAARLADYALAHGEPFEGGGNRPIRLDDPSALWYVAGESVNVFVAREQDGHFVEYKHLLRARQGRLLFPADGDANTLVVKGLPDSKLLRLPRPELLNSEAGGSVVEQVDLWVAELARALARDVTYRPQTERFVTAGTAAEVPRGTVVSTNGPVAWVSGSEGGLAFLSTQEADSAGSGFIPLAPGSWVSASVKTRLRVASSLDLFEAGQLLSALSEFHRLALSADDLNYRLLLADAVNLRSAQTRYRRDSVDAARDGMLDLFDAKEPNSDLTGGALAEALALIGDHEGIRFKLPPSPRGGSQDASDANQLLERILIASGIRGRDVALGTGDRWWFGDSGAMLAFRRSDGAPLVLLPGPFGRYRIVDPASKSVEWVNAERAASLQSNAIFFYQSLQRDLPHSARALAGVAFRNCRGDVLRFVCAGMLGGVAMLVPAILLGVFAEEVLPTGRAQTLAWLTAGMLLLAVTAGLLKMLEGTALMRLEGRAAARLTAALWDRLLDLPAVFFRKYTAGDLATRAMAFQALRDQVSGVVLSALLSIVFLLPTFVLLFLYDAALGWLGLVAGLFALAATVTLGALQVTPHRRLAAAQRTLSGDLLQLIGAAHKLRATGKEWTAFTRWAKGYKEQTRSELEVGALNEHLVAFTATTPLLATAILFAAVAVMGPSEVSPGMFLAVYAAYMVFMVAIAALGQSMSALSAVVPAVEQVAPILKTHPRRSDAGDIAMPELHGGVQLDNVSFRYTESGPEVLRDLSIHVQPGEFIALVGGSGSGKSTVLRLILGIERPTSGVVYYDGRDLDRVNRRAFHKSIGVVVQDGALRPRTVCDNIIGVTSDLTLDDAWRAAKLAAVDGDIMAMPMGMFTVVTENSSSFSGGQVQRIMLAAALVRNPRLLLLDEATSWLDNATQAQIMSQIEELAVTRVVVAHRLSTIRNADRIYVLDEGQVAQQGTYAQLMGTPGIFRDLAHRQIA